MTSAVVVGSGPNGLAGAITLAAAGLDVTVLEAADQPGGGVRSYEGSVPGLIHDECSAFHPLAVSNAFTAEFNLTDYGLRWAWPEVQFAHPLDDGKGAAVVRSVDDTAVSLGNDRARYRALFGPLVKGFDRISAEIMQPMLHVPRHPILMGRSGAAAALPAKTLARY